MKPKKTATKPKTTFKDLASKKDLKGGGSLKAVSTPSYSVLPPKFTGDYYSS
jgi:hypothetical protein